MILHPQNFTQALPNREYDRCLVGMKEVESKQLVTIGRFLAFHDPLPQIHFGIPPLMVARKPHNSANTFSFSIRLTLVQDADTIGFQLSLLLGLVSPLDANHRPEFLRNTPEDRSHAGLACWLNP